MLDELGNWRKTHYTKDVSSEMMGKEVILGGWVRNFRNLGGLKFINLQDKYGERQVTFKKGVVSEEIFEKAVSPIGRAKGSPLPSGRALGQDRGKPVASSG